MARLESQMSFTEEVDFNEIEFEKVRKLSLRLGVCSLLVVLRNDVCFVCEGVFCTVPYTDKLVMH